MSDDQKKSGSSEAAPRKDPSTGTRLTLTSLDARNAADHAAMTARLNGHAEEVKSIKSNYDRLDFVVRQLGERLGQDHDAIVTQITPRLDRFEELVGKGVSLDMASAIVGFTPDEVKQILEVQSQDDLSNSDIVSGLVEGVRSLKSQLRAVGDVVADHTRWLDDQDKKIKELRGAAHADAMSIDSRARAVFNEMGGNRVPSWGWFVATALGIVGFLLWEFHDWPQATHSATGTEVVRGVTAEVTNTTILSSAADHWYFALLFGVAIFVIVLGLTAFISGSSTTEDEEHRSLWQRYTSRRETRRAERQEQRDNGARLIDNVSEPEPEKEAVG